MDTVLETLTEGLGHHRAGRLAEAEALYRAALDREPGHPDALHLAGMLALDAGRPQEALGYIAKAIQAKGDVPQFHNNLGIALQALGRHPQACLCFTQALILAPGFAEAHVNFGNSLQSLGLLDEAVMHYESALRARPELAEAHNNLGNALLAQGRLQAAEACYREALRLKPDYAEAWLDLSGALMGQERFEEAVACCRETLRLVPGMADAYSNLGAIYSAAECYEQAEAAAQEALARKPDLPDALVVLSVVRHAQKRFDEAEECARRALALRPDYAEGWNNLGNALQEKGRLEEAEACYQSALRAKPGLADAHYNLGNTLRLKRRLAEARACYGRAIQLRPGHVKAHWNRSLTLLLDGDLEHGWEEFEWRWRKKDTPPRRFPQPLWDGSPPGGRTILLHAEQGLGDTIQFVRYAELVKSAGATVVMEAPAKLAALLGSVPGIDRIVPAGSPLPEFHLHVPLLSLPRLFRTTLDGIPARVPYIAAGADFRARWEQRLSGHGHPRIGLAWRGNPQHAEDRFRSLDWEALAPLIEVAGIHWFSLQHGERPGAAPGAEIVDLGPETEDFRDAAAAMEQMDLVISVDTSMAHLAGALARPTWVLLPFLPDWRWLLGRADTPWYPTMRLFRQPRRGDWGAVIQAVREELERGFAG
jgi:tetratricopeptide (TPR) repeat protein